jgi:hypothetical protein
MLLNVLDGTTAEGNYTGGLSRSGASPHQSHIEDSLTDVAFGVLGDSLLLAKPGGRETIWSRLHLLGLFFSEDTWPTDSWNDQAKGHRHDD